MYFTYIKLLLNCNLNSKYYLFNYLLFTTFTTTIKLLTLSRPKRQSLYSTFL